MFFVVYIHTFRNIMVHFSSSTTLGSGSNFIVMIATAFLVMSYLGQMSFWLLLLLQIFSAILYWY